MATIVINQTVNRIQSLTSKYVNSMALFFFVRKNPTIELSKSQNITLKINRYMSPLLKGLPANVRLGFWSLAQLQAVQIQRQTLKNSLILNPFKSQKLIRSSLMKGITKLMVSDIQELSKIQQSFFKLRKQGIEVNQPEYIWAIEDADSDLQTVIDLQKVDLPINGFYFEKNVSIHDVNKFMKNKLVKKENFSNFKQIQMKNFHSQYKFLKEYGVEPLITNYSQTSNYLMVCRIIGKNKLGQPIFENSCLDFICDSECCSCYSPNIKIEYIFTAGGKEWAIVEPCRLDKLRQEYIQQ